MVVLDPVVEISLIAAAVVAVSKFLQGKLIDKQKQKESQRRIKEKQAKIKELMQKTDDKSKGEAQQLQKELFEEMGESMQGSLRYMMFSLPIFFGAFILLDAFYGGMLFQAPFLVPKFEGFFFLNPFSWLPVAWVTETGWLKWYFISYLIISIVVGITMKIKDKVVKQNKAM